MREIAPAQILTNIAEVLELPGEPADYHFRLQFAAGHLYDRRRERPELIGEAERLFLLDLQLIQARPDIVARYDEGHVVYYQIQALPHLLRRYLTEGRVGDAAAIAAIAERFGVGAMPDVAAARTRAAALAAEDAAS